jgi:hypothetical protein
MKIRRAFWVVSVMGFLLGQVGLQKNHPMAASPLRTSPRVSVQVAFKRWPARALDTRKAITGLLDTAMLKLAWNTLRPSSDTATSQMW